MNTMTPIEFARERLIIARLVMSIMQARAKHYYPTVGIAASYELQLVATAVFIGHASSTPVGASNIARYIGMPRATVLRKLAVLLEKGFVIKKGRFYCINPSAVNGPEARAIAKANIRRIQAAAKELSKLDENR